MDAQWRKIVAEAIVIGHGLHPETAIDIDHALEASITTIGGQMWFRDPRNPEKFLFQTDSLKPGGIGEFVPALREAKEFLFGASKATEDLVTSKADLKTPKERAAFIGRHGEQAYCALPERL